VSAITGVWGEDAPPAVITEPRTRLADVVPVDIMRWVRLALMGTYLVAYLWWLRNKGLPLDRISVAIALGIFLVCAFVGRPGRQWAILVIDVVLYSAMWFAYEMTRGAADHLGAPLQVQSVRNIDRFLFFGHDPNVVLQEHFWGPTVRWWDEVASFTYYTHFVFPVIAMAVLWATSHRQWARFMKRFATLLAVACTMFVVLPTVPPWMASDRRYPYQLFDPLQRQTWRGFYGMGFKAFVKSWQDSLDWGNAIAAMPSLHASFALLVPAFFLPWIKPTWLKAVVLCFPVVMLTSLVYLAEHWVIDGIIGWLIVAASFWFWNRIEARQRSTKAGRARVALGATPLVGP
jgi:membrane-associated phospholipid phosphatase